jgi:hypothetical protein
MRRVHAIIVIQKHVFFADVLCSVSMKRSTSSTAVSALGTKEHRESRNLSQYELCGCVIQNAFVVKRRCINVHVITHYT